MYAHNEIKGSRKWKRCGGAESVGKKKWKKEWKHLTLELRRRDSRWQRERERERTGENGATRNSTQREREREKEKIPLLLFFLFFYGGGGATVRNPLSVLSQSYPRSNFFLFPCDMFLPLFFIPTNIFIFLSKLLPYLK